MYQFWYKGEYKYKYKHPDRVGYEAISWPSNEFVLTQEDSAPCLDATRVVSAITDLPPAVNALHWALPFQLRTDALQS